ncbi:c-type cytochrome [Phenylobacterium montanum]|uniref:Cytochrome c n=1 Tax=Phenylobacterium montanum TaxID=2823693 RepID=A0A975FW15_9CAUL|nr:cytochrome c [Caulobacter sp. S6]QUD85987.1 cytochrome c [Caulobacter sp. S6]
MKSVSWIAVAGGLSAVLLAAAPGRADPPGAQMFADNCSACHQPQGQGIPGAFPALAGDVFVQGPPAQAAGVVLRGRGGMPSFANDLTDDQISQILTYVRSSWGNKAEPVTVAVVADQRAKFKAETGPPSLQAH